MREATVITAAASSLTLLLLQWSKGNKDVQLELNSIKVLTAQQTVHAMTLAYIAIGAVSFIDW